MRLRNNPAAREAVSAHPAVWDESRAIAQRGRWQEVFPVSQPLQVEIGMGRGRFILHSAYSRPDINFLGLELREEMVLCALSRLAQLPDNLRFLWLNAERLEEIFAPGEAERLYINFPDPWPKSRHAKRRLTAPPFLARYEQVLAPGGDILLKTDNPDFFAWSRAAFAQANWVLEEAEPDLPAESSGVMTEYEGRYRAAGKPIFFLRASRPKAE